MIKFIRFAVQSLAQKINKLFTLSDNSEAILPSLRKIISFNIAEHNAIVKRLNLENVYGTLSDPAREALDISGEEMASLQGATE